MLFRTTTATQAKDEENAINKKISNYLRLTPDICCKICENLFNCTHLKIIEEPLRTNEWVIPGIEVLDCINNNNLETFQRSLDPFSEEIPDVPEPDEKLVNCDSFAFELPKDFGGVLKKCQTALLQNADYTQPESNFEEVLKFFKLNSLEDLFRPVIELQSNSLEDTIIYEPNQSSSEEKLSPVLSKTQQDGSPILCSYERVKFMKDKVQKQLFTSENLTQVSAKPRLSNLLHKNQKSFSTPNNKEVTSQKSRNTIFDDSLADIFGTTGRGIDDIFDTSFFPEKSRNVFKEEVECSKATTTIDVLSDIDEICDLSMLTKPPTKQKKLSPKKICSNRTNELNRTPENSSIMEKKSQEECNEKNDSNGLFGLDDVCDLSLFQPNKTTTETQGDNKIKQSPIKVNLIASPSKKPQGKASAKSQNTPKKSKQSPINVKSQMKNGYMQQVNNYSFNEKTAVNKKLECLEDDFEDFIPPKKINLSTAKSKNIDSVLKKYLPDTTLSIPGPSQVKKSTQQSQLSITQILDIINEDNTKTTTAKMQTRKSDSEDEFETSRKSRNNNQRSKGTSNKLKFESDDEFQVPLTPKIKNRNVLKYKQRSPVLSQKTKQKNPFIEFEAEVSDEEGVIISDDECVENSNCLESSFVNDESQVFCNTQMHAHYLQSVR